MGGRRNARKRRTGWEDRDASRGPNTPASADALPKEIPARLRQVGEHPHTYLSRLCGDIPMPALRNTPAVQSPAWHLKGDSAQQQGCLSNSQEESMSSV